MANYQSFTVLVSLDLDTGAMSFDTNPVVIPDDTIATITWGINPSDNNIKKFTDFSWYGGGKSFMSNHTMHDHQIFMGFNNATNGNNGQSGSWTPVITVKGTDDKTYTSREPSSGGDNDPGDIVGTEAVPVITTNPTG